MATKSTRAEQVRQVTGCDISGARVLMVGAGGIGCELLKNLVLCGFKHIEMVCTHGGGGGGLLQAPAPHEPSAPQIDLDTIDYSNLNRQFLFRQQHVNRSKAEVARETVLTFPHGGDLEIVAHHGNVKDSEFGIDYFKGFSIVLNALDNLEARRHVNRLCLAADVPLIESGTEGYLGQVTVIRKGLSECYECQPKTDGRKTYPICTIRNHPDKPVHCIAWAKELLFKKVFAGEDTDLVDQSEAPDTSAAPAAADGPAPPVKLEKDDGEEPRAFAARAFNAVFSVDVQRLLAMESIWKTRTPPKPLDLASLVTNVNAVAASSPEEDHAAWTIAGCAEAFISSVTRHFARAPHERATTFDKDDDVALDFVTAAANLRAAVFGIPLESRFKVKEIAGNIIPAIATTNAIIAGYIVVEALKVLSTEGVESCANVYLSRSLGGRRKDKLIVHAKVPPPDPACFVCGKASVTVTLDLGRSTGEMLIKSVLQGKLSFHEPTVNHGDRGLYECGEELEQEEIAANEAKLPKLLSEAPFSLTDGAMLDVDDHSQSLACQLLIRHCVDLDPEKHPEGFIVAGSAAAVAADATPASLATESNGDATAADDDFVIVDKSGVVEQPAAKKRKLGKSQGRSKDDVEPIVVD